MENVAKTKSFLVARTMHYHKPITKRIYYNNYMVMETTCSICKEQLGRWIIDEDLDRQSNISCPIGAMDSTEIS